MTSSHELMTDQRRVDDKVRIGGNCLLELKCYGLLSLVLGDGQFVVMSDAAYVPDLCFNVFSLKAAQIKGVMYTPPEDGSILLFDAKMSFPPDRPGNSCWSFRNNH